MDSESLIDQIYEAGAVPELWTGVLERLGTLAGSHKATLIVPSLGRWLATPAVEDTVGKLVRSGLIADNERTNALVAADHPGFVTDLDFFPLADIPSIPAYRDFFIPEGGGLGVGTIVRSPTGEVMIFHIEVPIAEGGVPRETVDALDRLRPHLARASLLSARLELQRATSVAVTLELVGLPGAVLDSTGRIAFANRLLNRFIPSMVQDRRARATLVDKNADGLLEAALARITAGSDSAVSSIPLRAQEDNPPAIVHLVPVRGAAHDVFTTASAIMVVTPVVPKDVPSAEIVQGLFDLTPAEARVARDIGRGKTVEGIVAASGVAPATVRSQVKAILAKTGLHRQGDLVGLLRGVSMIAWPPDT